LATAKKTTVRRTGAGIAGAGGGTGVLGLAALIPENHAFIKQLAIYSAPTISIVLAATAARATDLAVKLYTRWEMRWTLKQARRLRDEIVNSPHSSAAHKKLVQGNVEKLERLAMEIVTDPTDSISARLVGSNRNPSDPS
jgi:hypothetical protein